VLSIRRERTLDKLVLKGALIATPHDSLYLLKKPARFIESG